MWGEMYLRWLQRALKREADISCFRKAVEVPLYFC